MTGKHTSLLYSAAAIAILACCVAWERSRIADLASAADQVAGSPVFENQLDFKIRDLDGEDTAYLPPLTTQGDEQALIIFSEGGSACVASGCAASACVSSGCAISGCVGSACAGSGCGGSACGGSACGGSACGGSGCVGSGCAGSGCVNSNCVGSGCVGTKCVGSACKSCSASTDNPADQQEAEAQAQKKGVALSPGRVVALNLDRGANSSELSWISEGAEVAAFEVYRLSPDGTGHIALVARGERPKRGMNRLTLHESLEGADYYLEVSDTLGRTFWASTDGHRPAGHAHVH